MDLSPRREGAKGVQQGDDWISSFVTFVSFVVKDKSSASPQGWLHP